MNRHANPLRLIRNIRRIVDVNKVSKRSIKDNKSKKRYLVPLIKNTILVIIAITLAETIRINAIARCLPLSVSDKQKQKRLLNCWSNHARLRQIHNSFGIRALPRHVWPRHVPSSHVPHPMACPVASNGL